MFHIGDVSKEVNIIVAMTEERVIGYNNDIPWSIPEDLKRFAKITEGSTVIMGRRTWESIPERHRPLKNRHNIVVTNTLKTEQVHTAPDVVTALAGAPTDKVFLIGGENIYNAGLKYTDKIYLTVVDGEYLGDTYFPVTKQEDWEADSPLYMYNDHSFIVLKRVK
jgi:dihydrofolate reductase